MTSSMDELMLVLNFTIADLNANRSGRLGATQMARLKRNKQRVAWIALGLFFAFVTISSVLIFVGQNSQNAAAFFGGFVLILANALTVGIMGREYMRLDSDLRAGTVDALAGNIERVIKRGRRSDSHLLRIEDEEIYVTRETLECFNQNARYRIFRSRRARNLLSAELIT